MVEQWTDHQPVDRFNRLDFARQALNVSLFIGGVAVNNPHI